MTKFVFLIAAVVLIGCNPARGTRSSGPVRVTGNGLRVVSGDQVDVLLLPGVKVDGTWHGMGLDGACFAEKDTLTCPAGRYGTVNALLTGNRVIIRFDSEVDADVSGFVLEGGGRVDRATAWLSNGFQSWSQSGPILIGQKPTDKDLRRALNVTGTTEVLRGGKELSWWFTWIGGPGHAMVAGALSADKWRSWAQVYKAGNDLTIRLVNGDAGDLVHVDAGGTVDSETWFITAGPGLQDLLMEYGRALPTRKPGSRHPRTGWNSWYALWDRPDETAIEQNAALAMQILGPIIPKGSRISIVIDDGWEAGWGDWQPNDRFPDGIDGVVRALKSMGFDVGIWLAPLLVQKNSDLAALHPEWFVKGALYKHPTNGDMLVLDVTNPDAARHLDGVIRRITGWGISLLKIDFLFAGAMKGDRYEKVTSIQAYRRAITLIRDAAGKDVRLVAVGALPIAGFDLLDTWRLGPDIAYEIFGPGWAFIQDEARSLAARWPLCLAVTCDADPVLLRKLPKNEVDVGARVVGFTGGDLFLSDDLRKLPEERRAWGQDEFRAGLSMSDTLSIPQDLVPEDPPESLANAVISHLKKKNMIRVPGVWLMPDGSITFINWGDEPSTFRGVKVPARSAVLLK